MERLVFLLVLTLAAGHPAAGAAFRLGAHHFTLPDGFEIDLVAGPSLVPRPIEADFDELGRLYVTDSSGSNDKVEKQLAEKPHRVVRLEDTDGDGRFDKSITFADRMMLPQGCLWFEGSLYVAAPPSIWKLTDTNSDGRADVRVEWFQGKTLTGCANDLHGPYAGPDGWIYWCKGAFARQTYTLPNGREFTTRASHIFRARPDGTRVEPVMTGGMDNPVGLAFTPSGEPILSGTFFQHPAGGKRDGLIHALYGGVYGKDHDAIDGHPRTGELLPIMTHLGPAAPAGLLRAESAVLGAEYQNNFFTACFNLHKVVRSVPAPAGATYRTADSDFLVSDNPDFHPTDVLEDADGSLLVVDTGGWYKLCCPTSQLHKPDVLGGIYRVRRTGAKRWDDPRGRKIAWDRLGPSAVVATLADERPAVRQRAIRELTLRGTHDRAALDKAARHPSPSVRRDVAFALAGMTSAEARKQNHRLLRDTNATVRAAALHAVALWRDALAYEPVSHLLRSPLPSERRFAATALGRIGARLAVSNLLTTDLEGDRALEHALAYALIEIADPAGTAAGLSSPRADTQRLALLALDQMPGGGLRAEAVLPLLTHTNAALRDTARWLTQRHADWGGDLARWIQASLRTPGAAARSEWAGWLARSAGQVEVQRIIAEMAGTTASRATALDAMARSGLTPAPAGWVEPITTALQPGGPVEIRQAALRAVGKSSSDPAWQPALLALARENSAPPDLRLRALSLLPRTSLDRDEALFAFLQGSLADTNPVTIRGAAAGILARATLGETQLLTLAVAVAVAGPMELPRLLGVFHRATNEALGLVLVQALATNRSLAALRPETLAPYFTNYPPSVRAPLDTLLATLKGGTAQQRQHIDELLASVKGGDIRRGQAIFNSAKTACSACHAIGYLGGTLGPDLTRIGQIRNERDLLEAIAYPNASFVRSYEPVIVVTRDGEEYSGVLRRDADDEVVLATGPDTEQRIARAAVAEMRPGSVSVMPGGLAEQLTREELADLLAFLKATRW